MYRIGRTAEQLVPSKHYDAIILLVLGNTGITNKVKYVHDIGHGGDEQLLAIQRRAVQETELRKPANVKPLIMPETLHVFGVGGGR